MAMKRKLSGDLKIKPYEHASGGWGSVGSLAKSLTREHVPLVGPRVLLKQNKTGGFMCVSCAWAKPADPRVFEFCENGAKERPGKSRTSASRLNSLPGIL